MRTSNTEEMVTFSRAEYERLQQEKARNAKVEAKFAAREQEQAQVITSLTLQNEWLLEQLKPVSYTHLDVYKRQPLL